MKLIATVLAFALLGTAHAATWRSLVVDASSEAAFADSLAVFADRLSPARRYVFGEALKDIWVQGVAAAEADQREYTADEYYRRVHGLSYEQVTTLADPSGDTAKERYRTASLRFSQRPSGASAASPWPSRPAPIGPTGEQRRGGNYTHAFQ